MIIAIGCDPNALEYKKVLTEYVASLGHKILDFGSNDPIYANTAVTLGETVASGKADRGILICGTGIGMSIAANKVPGVYAALINNIYQAERAELSNHANVIALGAQVLGIELAKCLVEKYLSISFDPNSRSAPKIDRIIQYEREYLGHFRSGGIQIAKNI